MGSYASPPLGWESYIIYLEFFCMGDLFFLYLFNRYLHRYGLLDMDSWIFFYMYFELLSNTAVFIMLLTFQLWLLGALSVASCIHLTCSHHCVCVWLPYFMALNYYGLILSISFPSPRFSYFPSESCFCLLEKSILRKQDLGLA